ncbi:hypothetical protein KSP40_PGU012704 [Platanthera guangdongensis]|uniref:DCD domain-containing protein n=1 Tax=Platanthera guangdongensis TaxID=2320717 RepID=A0ABR2LUH9_9ASPA
MASKDCKEQLSSANQPENVETEVILPPREKQGEDFLIAVENDKIDDRAENEEAKTDKVAGEVYATTAVPTLSGVTVENLSTVVGHEKANEGGEKEDVGNDKKIEVTNSSSNKGTKKILRKRKKNAEEVSPQAVSSSSKVLNEKLNDTSAVKPKEAPTSDKTIEGNGDKDLNTDEKLEPGAICVDEEEKSGGKDKKAAKKVVKKKNDPKAKSLTSNSDSAPTKAEATAVAPTSTSPAVEKKDIEGTEGNTSIDAGKLNNKDKPSPSATKKPSKKAKDAKKQLKKADDGEKQLKKVDGMGLVFMCNAKTKKDCFKYHILGLPESKKELVAKIYKGMRLFLFDIDLKLMYGIYKAAGPGGYNIESKAFDSKFPSQVRFNVLKDCLPLPEETFRAAIKDNYFKRNMFDCQLSSEQVKNLCKLFANATGGTSKPAHRAAAVRAAPLPISGAREPKRRRVVGTYMREAYLSPPRVRYQSPPRARYQSPPRVRYLSPPPHAFPLQALPHAAPRLLPPSYAYEQSAGDHYRRDLPRVLEPAEYQDPYALYREPARYREPAYLPAYTPGYAQLRQPRSPPRYLY